MAEGWGRRRVPGRRGMLAVLLMVGVPGPPVAVGRPIGGQGVPGEVKASPVAPDTGIVLLEVEVRAETGETIPGVEVSLRRTTSPQEEDSVLALTARSDGRFAVRVRVGDHARLRARARGYVLEERRVSLARPGRRFIRLLLRVDPVRLPDIIARGRIEREVQRAGHALEQVRFQDQAMMVRNVGEWLRTLPGVSVRGTGPGGGQIVSVRGARATGVLVLLDGVPVNDPVVGTADLSGVPVSTLESATLVRGTSSSRYGSGALGGVVLLRSRAPAGTIASLGFGLGSLGSRSADLFASAAGRSLRLALSASHERSDNDFRFRNRTLPGSPLETRRNADGSRASVVLSALGVSRLRPRFTARYDRSERGSPGRIGTRLFDDARWSEETLRGSAGLGLPGSAGAGIAVRRQRIAFRSGSTAGVSRQVIWDGRLTGEARLGGRLGLRASARLERESVEGDGVGGATTRWSGGGRLGRPFESVGFGIEPAVAFDVAPGTRAWSPELTVKRGRPGGTEAWARVGRGFRLPTFGDLYFASAYGVRPNPDLRAEVVTLDGELGVSVPVRLAGGRVRVRAAVHGRRTRDPIVWLASSAAVWSPRNLEALRSLGLEWSATLDDPDAPWGGGAWIGLESSRLGFGDNRNPLPYQPEFSGGVTIERRWASAALRAAIRVTGSRTTSVAGTRRLPAFTRLDLGIRRNLGFLSVPLSLEIMIEDVFDERFELVELYPEPGRTARIRLRLH